MKDNMTVEFMDEQAPADIPRERSCLRCRTTFQSEWAGERICGRCKSTNAWRSGDPIKSHPTSIRR